MAIVSYGEYFKIVRNNPDLKAGACYRFIDGKYIEEFDVSNKPLFNANFDSEIARDIKRNGQTTKYTPELLEKAHSYIANWRTLGDMIPSHDALCGYLDITSPTLYDWRDQEGKEEFSCILDTISRMQRQELINNGLSGDFNAAITKLVLGKHGYSDKVDTDVTSKGQKIENNITVLPVQNG